MSDPMTPQQLGDQPASSLTVRELCIVAGYIVRFPIDRPNVNGRWEHFWKVVEDSAYDLSHHLAMMRDDALLARLAAKGESQ